jgi:cytochrome c oxidase subunit 2
VYQQSGCRACHSIDGTPGTGPSWRGDWGAPRPGSAEGQVDEAYVRESILNPAAYIAPGFQNVMPSFQGVLTDDQINGVVAYIRQLNGVATAADTTLASPDSTGAGPAATPGAGPADPSQPVGLGIETGPGAAN